MPSKARYNPGWDRIQLPARHYMKQYACCIGAQERTAGALLSPFMSEIIFTQKLYYKGSVVQSWTHRVKIVLAVIVCPFHLSSFVYHKHNGFQLQS